MFGENFVTKSTFRELFYASVHCGSDISSLPCFGNQSEDGKWWKE